MNHTKMRLISVNIGPERTLVRPNKTEQTGIFKEPVTGAVSITQNGLAGDFIGDSKHHGGPDQAVYIYGSLDYEWWKTQLGTEPGPGTFGENLTISGLESGPIQVGDILRIGEIALQVTAPRIPCGTLAGRMKIPDFARQFRFAERPGLYCRVLAGGQVQAGDEVRLEPFAGQTITIAEVMRDYYEPDLTEASLRRYLNAPIAIRVRRKKEEQLEQILKARPA
jgi:MOSC domain-containing protein YiiM